MPVTITGLGQDLLLSAFSFQVLLSLVRMARVFPFSFQVRSFLARNARTTSIVAHR